MDTATTTTFQVLEVQPATTPLPEVPYKQAVEALLTIDSSEQIRSIVQMMGKKFPKESPLRSSGSTIEACSRYHGHLLAHISFHPLVGGLHYAFLDHRPLILSPDMIWLLICQGVANHINANAVQLRSHLVRHHGILKIKVRRDDFIKGSPENPWTEVFHEFSTAIRSHVGPDIDRFLPAFTTTGPVERAACEVVLLDTMQSFFIYELETICGIPSITLEGTQEDWQTLAERVQSFGDLELDWWLGALSPLLHQFTEAACGRIDQGFWQSIYKYEGGSGGPYITGWITTFFPYLNDASTGRTTVRNHGFREDEGRWIYHPSRLTLSNLPQGLSRAPFLWEYLSSVYNMEFLGGFVGVAQNSETLALRPEIGWAVREAPAAE